jgi:hypothetical protein
MGTPHWPELEKYEATSADRYLSYADGKYEAHILYRDLLARTKAWSMQEYQK